MSSTMRVMKQRKVLQLYRRLLLRIVQQRRNLKQKLLLLLKQKQLIQLQLVVWLKQTFHKQKIKLRNKRISNTRLILNLLLIKDIHKFRLNNMLNRSKLQVQLALQLHQKLLLIQNQHLVQQSLNQQRWVRVQLELRKNPLIANK